MPVLVHRKVMFAGEETEIKSYMPPGTLIKAQRVQADELDEFLMREVPRFSREIEMMVKNETNLIKKWYLLGVNLVKIAENQKLVYQADIDNSFLWQAVWYYLPDFMIPAGTNREKPYFEKQHKRQDHLSISYELGKFEWNDVSWLQRWSDWHEITARPALLRDKRILSALGKEIQNLGTYPSKEAFQDILKRLAEVFPTKQFRDSSNISDSGIIDAVRDAIGYVQ